MRSVHSIMATAALLVASSASAATIYSNNFNTENGGLSQLNYAGFSGLSVVAGSVDLIASGNFGITCAGGSGACVDLNGSTNQDSRLNVASFNFLANTLYTFSFDLSGNQRGTPDNNWFVGVEYDDLNVYNFFRLGGAFPHIDLLQDAGTIGTSTGAVTSSATPFQTYSIGFSLKNAGTATFFIGSNDVSNAGPVVDNFLITGDTAAVPEPASWAMLIAGFGLVGAVARRRRLVAA
jgi:PEP-CTERM motif